MAAVATQLNQLYNLHNAETCDHRWDGTMPRYIVALDFDYFDGDFDFGDLEKLPLLNDMQEDALSEGYIREFDAYDDALVFAQDVIARICARAVTDTEHKREFIRRIHGDILAPVIDITSPPSGRQVTFDLGQEYGNWSIRIRLLSKSGDSSAWDYPVLWW